MYKIFYGNTMICSSAIEDLAIINPVISLEANKAGTFKFTMPPTHPNYNDLQSRGELLDVYRDDEEEPLFEGIITDSKVDFYKQKQFTCEGDLSFLNDSILRPSKKTGLTVRQLLESYIQEHNSRVGANEIFQVGQVTVTDPNNSITCFTNYNSTMKEIKEDLLDDLGGFLRTRHDEGVRYLDYLAEPPRINPQEIRIGENLLDFTQTHSIGDLATVVIPLGAKQATSSIKGLEERLTIKTAAADSQHPAGADYVESTTAISNFGRIEQTVVFDNVTTVSRLLQKGKKYLQDTQFAKLVLSVKAIDLGLTSEEFEKFRLLDEIRIISEPHGLDRLFTLTKMTINLNNPENDSITLGQTVIPTLTAKSTGTSVSVQKIDSESVTPSFLQSAIDNATALITGSEGGYVVIEKNAQGQPIEIKIQNALTNPTKIWRWNQNGFGYSKDGGQTYGTAITMNGAIVADYISSGILKAINIDGVNISGSVISSTGSVTRKKANYSQADVTRIYNILNGTVTPTDADYEKLDLDGDGVISATDAVRANNLATGAVSQYTFNTSITISGEGNQEVIKLANLAIGNAYIRAKNGIFKNNLVLGSPTDAVNVRVYDGTTEKYGYTGTKNNIKFVNGIAVN